jgi:hypothetical protein
VCCSACRLQRGKRAIPRRGTQGHDLLAQRRSCEARSRPLRRGARLLHRSFRPERQAEIGGRACEGRDACLAQRRAV